MTLLEQQLLKMVGDLADALVQLNTDPEGYHLNSEQRETFCRVRGLARALGPCSDQVKAGEVSRG